MISNFSSFISSQRPFLKLTSAFLLYLFIYFINQYIDNSLLSILNIVGGLFFMLLGAGFCAILILQWVLKRQFSTWEFISLSLASGIIVPAAILQIEFLIKNQVSDWYPIANSIFLWITACLILYLNKTSFPNFDFSKKQFIKHPLLIVFIFGLFFTAVQVLMYPTLPDLDPYKWLLKYTYQFPNHLLDYAERPLFGSFIFTGTRLLNIDILTFFKYVIPFLFLTVLFPAWMIAREFEDTRKQWLWLFFVFASPVIILYAQTAMPQSILIVLSYFIVFFLLRTYQTQNNLFIYGTGIIALLSFFFHQAGIILFAIWALITVIGKGHLLFNDKKTAFISILLLATNLHYLKNSYTFLLSWISMVYSHILSANNFNPFYPAQYSNVDLISMGWNSFGGVIKFYAFHAGPLILGLLSLFLAIFILNSKFRSSSAKEIVSHTTLIIIFGVFVLFFAMAEILPRFPNIALLPDRSWIFAGIFSFIFLFTLFKFIKKIPLWIMPVFAVLLTMVLAGATYVNYLKRHLTTPAQIESGKWIEKLPKDRFFLSYGHKVFLPIYTNTPLLSISSDLYCEKDLEKLSDIIDINTDKKNNEQQPNIDYASLLNDLEKNISDVRNRNTEITKEDMRMLMSRIGKMTYLLNNELNSDLNANNNNETGIDYIPPISEPANFKKFISVEHVYGIGKISPENLKNRPRYIYYARQNPLNPYYSRPYTMQAWGMKPCPDGKFSFDQYPDKFKRVYYTKDEEIIIWKVL